MLNDFAVTCNVSPGCLCFEHFSRRSGTTFSQLPLHSLSPKAMAKPKNVNIQKFFTHYRGILLDMDNITVNNFSDNMSEQVAIAQR